MLENLKLRYIKEGVLKLKKFNRVLLIILLVNLLGSFVYAGIGDEPRPVSIEPILTVEGTTIN